MLGIEALDGYWGHGLLSSTSLTIAGGTSEVNRNIIGERVLGLPREPKPTGIGLSGVGRRRRASGVIGVPRLANIGVRFRRRGRVVNDPLQYDGARVVVTGAASGMGAACATLLTELGAEVHGVDIKDGGAGLAALPPVRSRATLRPSTPAVAAIGGTVDSLFNCAGLPTTAPSQTIMRVNFVGPPPPHRGAHPPHGPRAPASASSPRPRAWAGS